MNKQGRLKRDTILGLVFFGALGVLFFATLELGSFALGEVRRLSVSFHDAKGVKTGDPVYVLGMRAGRVERVELVDGTEPPRVVLHLLLTEPVVLREDPVVRIQDSSVLGGKVVWIHPGRGEPPPPEPPRELVGEEVKGPLEAIGDLVARLESGEGTLGALLTERTLHDNLEATVADLRGLVEDVRGGRAGTIGLLFTDPGLYERAHGFFTISEEVAESIRAGEGLLGRLMSDDDFAEDVTGFASDLKELTGGLTEGRGMLGRLLTDEKMSEDAARAVSSLADTFEAASSGEGVVARLLNDRELGDRIASIIEGVDTAVSKITSGEGTLGRLVMDDTLIATLERAAIQLSRLLEDAREAAPIGTFFQVFGGLFY